VLLNHKSKLHNDVIQEAVLSRVQQKGALRIKKKGVYLLEILLVMIQGMNLL